MTSPLLELEGTWEEIAEQIKALDANKRFRLLLLPETEMEENGQQAPVSDILAELFAAAENAKPEPGKPSSDPYEAEFGEIIAEKYRKQGLNV